MKDPVNENKEFKVIMKSHAVCRLPCAVFRVQSSVCRPPCAVFRLPFSLPYLLIRYAMTENNRPVSFGEAFLPIGFFLGILIFGLFIHPQFTSGLSIAQGIDGWQLLRDETLIGQRLPVEVLVLMALCFNAFYLLYKGYGWKTIEMHMTRKVGESIPVVFILISVGVLIGSLMVSGTIPMLIYYGIAIVSPYWIYIFSFVICIIFSLLTGTSWGSAGTIGVVMMGIAQVFHADLAITAAAVVGGSFFGDKMSPLSDTTNIAALATEVALMDHIKSMAYTTGPSAILAAIIYIVLSPAISGSGIDDTITLGSVNATLNDLNKLFHFNVALLIPLVIVLWGSFTRRPIILTLLGASWVAMILAVLFQDFNLTDIFQSFNKGFSIDMAGGIALESDVVQILNRGGLYNLIEGVMICLLIFAYIGTLDVINAIDISIKKLMTMLKKQSHTVLAAIGSTLLTNITTSNQYATSFIIGSAFAKKFDEMRIPRKVLSRTLEDAGTMMENLFPWTPSGIFMAGALGVSALEYGPYQFLSLINIVVAVFFAVTGIACFYGVNKELKAKN